MQTFLKTDQVEDCASATVPSSPAANRSEAVWCVHQGVTAAVLVAVSWGREWEMEPSASHGIEKYSSTEDNSQVRHPDASHREICGHGSKVHCSSLLSTASILVENAGACSQGAGKRQQQCFCVRMFLFQTEACKNTRASLLIEHFFLQGTFIRL